jgi:single-stranded DNA-binding protein
VILGRLQQRAWTAEDGSARSAVEVVAEELGPEPPLGDGNDHQDDEEPGPVANSTSGTDGSGRGSRRRRRLLRSELAGPSRGLDTPRLQDLGLRWPA